LRPLSLLAITALFACHLAGAQQDRDAGQYTIGVDVDLVVFNTTVTDGKGRQVSGLKQSDFRVSEDGRPQQIRLFQPEDIPATVGLVIDSSGSMRNKLQEVVGSALGFMAGSCWIGAGLYGCE
jgi:Ca-activated chloride channel homolog